MIDNLFMRDESGVAAVTLPRAGCGCFDCIDADAPLAMAYVPMQRFERLHDLERAFDTGTLFVALDKPFLGGGARCDG